jgi:hypothetical protein
VSVTRRVVERVNRDYPDSSRAEVTDLLASLDLGPGSTPDGDERIHAAILIAADGDLERLMAAVRLARLDWRDLLVDLGLENDDWPSRVTESLGPAI